MKKEIFEPYNVSENNFEQCVKCTICTVYCPVLEVNPDYPGPKQSGPDGERMRLKDPEFYDEALKLCLNCKRCEVACPSGVKIGDIIQSARIKYSKSRPKLRDMILANTDIVGTMASTFAPIVNTAVALKPVRKVMDSVLKIDHHRMFPKYTGLRFETWYRRYAEKKQQKFKKHVSYFHGCYVNYNFPQQGKDLIKVMNAAGYGVHLLEKEKCCGVALISNGLIKQATKQAKHNVEAFKKSIVDKKMPVISTSSTCIFTIRDEYPHLLGVKNEEIRNDSELATRFLFRLIDEGKLNLVFKKNYKKRIAYHTPCHMEKLGWSIYSISLLRMIPSVELVQLESQCCGIAGTYGFKKENYQTSQEVGKPLFDQIENSKVDFVATDCETCKWQIEMSTSSKVQHPISILAEAIDVDATMKLWQK
ncbi:anaerobic glycerol-3-phosphate dehydrogenase subunit GlpC [Marinifilum sp. D714]|uniref:anaerobic glycerol-3-phosphate dehydrogenase subunit GlpC n=1 Tax=Marinifilum sp. D714 TaxID=2937523 RepID=UPI0027C23DBB|nr:anaerobic glycerol-3-phosphate dehydrogenase subunit GlpC [Marinifilum sp. D714]MDQ2178432.1 anaerobic glycerol-3-phosphate dehydrogenase subunit GlpC [Marinifilum sp. D714]